MTLNSTGLGVGVSPSYKIHSVVTSGFAGKFNSSTAVAGGILAGNSIADLIVGVDASGNGRLTADTSKYLGLGSNGVNDRVILDSSGNLGIGVTPSAWATYKAVSVGGIGASVFGLGSSQSGLVQGAYFSNLSGSGWAYTATSQVPAYYLQINGEHRFHNAISGTAGAQITAWTQAMTLDASGNLLVGTTSTSVNAGGLLLRDLADCGQILFSNNSGVAEYVARFYYGSTPTNVGNITVASGGTTYGTISDYRLKESVKPISGGLTRVNALKPSVYNWKADGSAGEGFLAHELAEVVPFAVIGEKDAVNEDGTIKSQGIDMSRIVPILVAAIQELTARVQTLEAR
jgi:hypothetical protein